MPSRGRHQTTWSAWCAVPACAWRRQPAGLPRRAAPSSSPSSQPHPNPKPPNTPSLTHWYRTTSWPATWPRPLPPSCPASTAATTTSAPRCMWPSCTVRPAAGHRLAALRLLAAPHRRSRWRRVLLGCSGAQPRLLFRPFRPPNSAHGPDSARSTPPRRPRRRPAGGRARPAGARRLLGAWVRGVAAAARRRVRGGARRHAGVCSGRHGPAAPVWGRPV